MYVNAKMMLVETIPGIGRGMGESSGGGEFKYDIFDNIVRTFINTIMYPHPAQ
jgi:hypothetical protein